MAKSASVCGKMLGITTRLPLATRLITAPDNEQEVSSSLSEDKAATGEATLETGDILVLHPFVTVVTLAPNPSNPPKLMLKPSTPGVVVPPAAAAAAAAAATATAISPSSSNSSSSESSPSVSLLSPLPADPTICSGWSDEPCLSQDMGAFCVAAPDSSKDVPSLPPSPDLDLLRLLRVASSCGGVAMLVLVLVLLLGLRLLQSGIGAGGLDLSSSST